MTKTRESGRQRMFKQIAKKKSNPQEINQNHAVWFILQRKGNRRKVKGGRVKPHNRKRKY